MIQNTCTPGYCFHLGDCGDPCRGYITLVVVLLSHNARRVRNQTYVRNGVAELDRIRFYLHSGIA